MTDYSPPLPVAYSQSDEVGKIALALSKAQGSFEAVEKRQRADIRGESGNYSFKYADLASIMGAIRAALSEQEIAVVQAPARAAGGGIEVTTTLMHSSGQWLRAVTWMFYGRAKDANMPRAIGSAISYARRYALLSMLAVATEDDDGKAAGRNEAAPREKPVPKCPYPNIVKGYRDHLGIEPAVVERYLGHPLAEMTEDEAGTLDELGKAMARGDTDAREQVCGPPPARAMEQELSDDEGPTVFATEEELTH